MKRNIFMVTATILVVAAGMTLLARQQQPTGNPPAGQPANQPLKIGIIDSALFDDENGIQQLVQQARRTQDSFKDQIARVQKLQQDTESFQRDLQAQWGRLTEIARQQKQDELEAMKRRLQRDGEDLQRDMDAALRKALQPVQERILAHLASYAQAHNFTIILDQAALGQAGAMPYFSPTLDVTRDFINDYNRANPARSESRTD
jgi:Skp family chaperone for outer membrane proteins